MKEWRADFREMADEIREEGGPEAVARLLEHVGDLGDRGAAQLEAGPWKRDVTELEYDELVLASSALNRIRDRAEETGRSGYVQPLARILATIEAEIRRRGRER